MKISNDRERSRAISPSWNTIVTKYDRTEHHNLISTQSRRDKLEILIALPYILYHHTMLPLLERTVSGIWFDNVDDSCSYTH